MSITQYEKDKHVMEGIKRTISIPFPYLSYRDEVPTLPRVFSALAQHRPCPRRPAWRWVLSTHCKLIENFCFELWQWREMNLNKFSIQLVWFSWKKCGNDQLYPLKVDIQGRVGCSGNDAFLPMSAVQVYLSKQDSLTGISTIFVIAVHLINY